jgi:hypothetical protein
VGPMTIVMLLGSTVRAAFGRTMVDRADP